jgi:hypothetical protein
MKEAFSEKNTEKLQAALDALPREEAARHLHRCIESGLWKPEGGAEEGGGGGASSAPPAPTEEEEEELS